MTRLLLLRHGQTHSNVAGALDTAVPGADLTDLGRRQADAAAQALEGTPIDRIAVSRLVRTHQTVAPTAAARGLRPTVVPGLEEVSAGSLEMATDDASVRTWLDALSAWFHDDLDHRVPDSEDGHEFLARFDAAVAQALGEGTTLVVSHGAAIRLWAWHRVADRHALPALGERIDNTGMMTLDLPDGASPSQVGSASWQVVDAHLAPLGGDLLSDHSEHDPTGDPAD